MSQLCFILLTKLAFLESCSVNSPWPRRSPHRDNNSTITHRSMYPHTRDASVLRGLYKPVRRETVAMRALMGACPLRVRGAGPRTHAQSRTCFIYCLAIYFILLQNVCRLHNKTGNNQQSKTLPLRLTQS